jgi:hypothetical protein
MKDLNQEKSFTARSKAESNEGTSMSTKDPDTMIGMTMLLLACIALTVLAHAVI